MNMHDDSPPDAKPPLGLIAEEALAQEEKAAPPVAKEAEPIFPGVDASYAEPLHPDDFRERLAANTGSGDPNASLITDLIARVEALETALLPFATHGSLMANVGMAFAGQGRANEPTGGTWLNGIANSQLQANQHIFYTAADVVGRRATEQRLLDIFKAVQEATAAMAERDKATEGASLAGPVGGPVTGRSH